MKKHWLSDLTLLLVFLALFYLLWLGSHPLMTPDEARYAEIAREMIATKDYITPRLNGAVFLDKPILYYWLQVSAIKLFGLNEWALRLWPALIGVLGCLLVYVSGRLLFNRRTGILSAIILATCPLYFGMAHYANLDLEVAVFISAALLAFIVAMRQQGRGQTIGLLVAYTYAGLAILTKGMIGIAFPIMIIGLWILLSKQWRVLLKMRLMSGLLIILLITAPWFYLVQQANPDFLQYFFLNQQFTRFVSTDFNDAEPVWFYLPIVLGGLIPWLIFLPQAILRQYKTELFLCLWPLVVFIFFTIPNSKTIGYIMPVIPPLALLIGRYLDRQWGQLSFFKFTINMKSFSIIVAIISIAELTVMATVKKFDLPSIKPLAITINHLAKPGDEVVAYYKYYQDLPLYTQRRITVVENWDSPTLLKNDDSWRHEISNYFHAPAAHQWLITDPVFWQRWHSNRRLFVLVNQPEVARFTVRAGVNCYKIDQYQDVILYSNQS